MSAGIVALLVIIGVAWAVICGVILTDGPTHQKLDENHD